ncbi:NAD(P)/FAD-dependent oxidoreductase [Mesorhizobium sp. 10J20-29]
METVDVLIIGAGAAGMMCAIEAAKRGRSVMVVEHAAAPGEKIRISGGGRCNFTNIHASPKNFLSQNPHFCISALSRYRPRDFIALVEAHGIAYHEKTLGQLFCDGSATQIIAMLRGEMERYGAELRLGITVGRIGKTEAGFSVILADGEIACSSLVVACGGKSIPKMGATGLGYEIAGQFGLRIVETRPALVPLTFDPNTLERLKPLTGIAVEEARVSCGKTSFSEAILFTHRGISGPAILQISSYWREGGEIAIAMLPSVDVFEALRAARARNGRQAVQTALAEHLPKKLSQVLAQQFGLAGNMADLPDKALRKVAEAVNGWRVKPAGSEGYRTAEVTLGGVDTRDLDSKTMQAKTVPGLYFVGEVVDVTGWLGGYNFQWAWASGWSAGQNA